MIDEDDDIPSFVVGSGSEHHVSVSEHTGNAKTPHNKVVSHQEEPLSRKLAFEKNQVDAAGAKAPNAKDAGVNSPTVPHDAPAGTNVQQITSEAISANRQAIAHSHPAGANVQDIPTEVIAPNVQSVHTDTLGNHQAHIGAAQQLGDNPQAVPSDVGSDNNRQKIGEDAKSPNVQSVSHNAEQTHREGIHTEGLSDNHQAIPSETSAANRQALAKTPASAGTSGITLPSGVNEQEIPTLNETINHQTVQDQSIGDNRQALNSADAAPNRQALNTQTTSPNHQAAPKAPEAGTNRQPVGTDALKDHKEAASSAPIVRAKVDFSKAASASAPASHNMDANAVRQAGKANKKSRPGVTLPGLIPDPAAASPEALEAAAEFHRRVLDIKHNVDNLNHRLTDFEQKLP